MNKIINKPSITKKQVWSLILEIKSIFNNFKRNQKTLSVSKKINNDNLRLTYSFDKQKIINKNFKVNNINEELFNIFLPIILNKSKEPYIIGHLAQTLDGYIATQAGESKYISCRENIEHIHRLRAISDIIIVGSKTVLLDNPKLTTRMVEGSNPLRMVLNSKNNLNNNLNIFAHKDRNGFKVINKNEQTKMNNIFSLPAYKKGFKISDIIKLIKKLNKRIVFIEGGGSTISSFYSNQYLNKLHLCISPIIIGDGRSSFILEKKPSIKDFKDHKISYYKMGSDILCDIDLSSFSTKKKNQAR